MVEYPEGRYYKYVYLRVPEEPEEVLEQKRADAISVAVKGSPDGSPAVDYTINCAVGYPHLTGPDTTPVNNVLPAWDVGCGLHAALAIVASVMARTGGTIALDAADSGGLRVTLRWLSSPRPAGSD